MHRLQVVFPGVRLDPVSVSSEDEATIAVEGDTLNKIGKRGLNFKQLLFSILVQNDALKEGVALLVAIGRCESHT